MMKKQSNKNIAWAALCLGLAVGFIGSNQSKREEGGAVQSLSDLDRMLTGRWTIGEGLASACEGKGTYLDRKANGDMEITGDDGQVMEKASWSAQAVYGGNVGSIRIDHPGRDPIYWAVEWSGQNMKTSIMLSRPPASKSEALADLEKPLPDHPEIRLPLLRKCS